MDNVEKAREIANNCSTVIVGTEVSDETYITTEPDCYDAAMQAMEWKDKQIQHVISCATANLIATLKYCKIFSDESIAKCAEEFKNDLIKEAKKGE